MIQYKLHYSDKSDMQLLEIEIINLKHNYLKICVQNYLYYTKWRNSLIKLRTLTLILVRRLQMMAMY